MFCNDWRLLWSSSGIAAFCQGVGCPEEETARPASLSSISQGCLSGLGNQIVTTKWHVILSFVLVLHEITRPHHK